MKRFWFMKGIMFLLLFCAFVLLFGFVVMWLWNWLMPVLFHLTTINYYQAVGLLALSRLLFYPFSKHGMHRHRRCGHQYSGMEWKNRWHEKMQNMTAEEKEEFRKKYENWCGNKSWFHNDEPHTENK